MHSVNIKMISVMRHVSKLVLYIACVLLVSVMFTGYTLAQMTASPNLGSGCPGTQVTYTVTPQQNGTIVGADWSVSGGVLSPGGSSRTVTWNSNGTVSVTYGERINSSTVVERHASASFFVDGPPTITGPTSVCYAQSGTFSPSFNPGTIPGAVIWQRCTSGCSSTSDAGWSTNAGGSTFDNFTVDNTQIRAKLTSAVCGKVYTNTISVRVDPDMRNATASISSTVSLPTCGSGSDLSNIKFNAGASGVGNPSYTWYRSGHVVNDDEDQSNPTVYDPHNPLLAGETVWVEVDYPYTCPVNKHLKSNVITISFINPVQPSVTINTTTPDTDFCHEEPVTFTAGSPQTITGYEWRINESVILSHNSTFTLIAGFELKKNDVVKLTAYVSGYCLTSNTVNVNTGPLQITINPIPTATITPIDPSIYNCEGADNGYAVLLTGHSEREGSAWSLIPPEAGTISNVGRVHWNKGFHGTAQIKVVVDVCSGLHTETQVPVDIHPFAPLPPETTFEFCEFEEIVLTHPLLDGQNSFRWYDSQSTLLGEGMQFVTGPRREGSYTFQVEAISEYGCASDGKSTEHVFVVTGAQCDEKLNYIEIINYDESGAEVRQSRDYFDYKGKALQQQQINFTAGHQVLASQTLRDELARDVLSTLPAPTATTAFLYQHRFVRDGGGDKYNYNDFDQPVGQDAGTVGGYYSTGNTVEDHVPATGYPYARADYYTDGSEVRKTAGPGEQLRLGGGHETWRGTFPVFNELNDYLEKRLLVLPGIGQPASMASNAIQTVVRDQNGLFAVSITDKNGQNVLVGRFGTAINKTLEVQNVCTAPASVNNTANSQYFYLTHQQAITVSGASGQFTNLMTGQTIAASSGTLPLGFYKLTATGGSNVTVTYKNYFTDVVCQFYDNAGHLRMSVSPAGYKDWATGMNYAAIDKTTYNYNYLGQVMSVNEPDAGETKYVYRRDGNIRFSENAQQRLNTAGKGKFSYTHYDEQGRPVESGEYTGTIGFRSQAMMSLLETPAKDLAWTDKVDWLKTVYDEPDGTIPNLPARYRQKFVRGAVSSTANENNKTWYSYDELGRVTWMAQKPAGIDRTFITEYTYDFLSNIITVANASYDASHNAEEKKMDAFYHHFEYDADERLRKSYTSTDGATRKLRATYFYYLHGPLKRIELGDKIQGIDFVYNINGWLTQINHPDKTRDPGGDTNDVFGMVLDYYESDMTGIFSLGSTINDAIDPHRFHRLPNTLQEQASQGLVFQPKPAYKQQMVDALQHLKKLKEEEEAQSRPVTLAHFKEAADGDEEITAGIGEMVTYEPVQEQRIKETVVASLKDELYPTPAANVVSDEIEFAALKAIYDNMNGAHWTRKGNWPTTWPASATSAQFGTWDGVTVSGGDITTINLSNNNLTGALVPEVGTLTQLVTLQLNTNAITSIPPTMGLLKKVVTLYLYNNLITAIPPDITGMSALKNFRIQVNQIGGNIPSFLGSMTTLTSLYLGDNLFTGGIPASFNALTQLTILDISSCQLTGPIEDLSALQSLTTFNVEQNQITGNIPAHLGNLHALLTLGLNGNAFYGPIPPEFNGLSNLSTMDLRSNSLSGSVPDLSNLKKLLYLYLHSNQLESIPASLGELEALQYLYLQGNRLTGGIPPELGKLHSLRRLYLNTNQLSGEMPASLGELSNLENLDFSANQLSGPLPASWSNMTGLLTLNLESNQLTGELPESWKSLTKLTSFNIGVNQLEGNIPTEYSTLTELTTFRVYKNRLSGEIPSVLFSHWSKLVSLFLFENEFTGPFPASIASCPSFAYLDANQNNFTSLPQEMLGLPALYFIRIQYNRLEFIPNFSTHPNKANLNLYLQYNLIDFTNWEPIFGATGTHGIKALGYLNQGPFTDPTRISVPDGTSLVITARPKGQYGTVIWEKKSGATWVNVTPSNEDATQQTFKVSSPTSAQEGIYRWTETDTKVPSLTLQSGEIQVKLGDALPDPLSTQNALYNGLISAVYWRTDKVFGTDEDEYAGMYRFEYDDKYQIKESRWGNPNKATWTSFADAGNQYRLTGMQYDPNGNIQKLKRYAEDGFIKNNFTYYYDDVVSKNRLTSVDQYTNAYGYDAVGRMITEKKVEGDDHYTEYDVTGKVRKVFFDPNKQIPNVEYQYDDRGFRLAKIDYQAKVTTWYIRDLSGNIIRVYEQKGNLSDPLRPVKWTSLTGAVYANGSLSAGAGLSSGSALASDTLHAGRNGYVEYTASEVLKGRTFGFSKMPGGVKFAFGFASTTSTFVISKSGAGQNFPGSNAYVASDKFRISRDGNKMRFSKNGIQLLDLDIAEADEFVVSGSITTATSSLKSEDLVYKFIEPEPTDTTLTLKEIPVYGAGKLGTYYPQEEGSVAYEITDHLGNVRALLRDHVNTYTATMEDSGQPVLSNPRMQEMQYFENLFETSWTDANMNHTPADATIVEMPENSAFLFWHDGGGAYPLGDVSEKSIGPAIGLKVKPGDFIDMETWVRYEKRMQNDDEEQLYTSALTMTVLSQILGSNLAYTAGFESLTSAQATSALNAGLTLAGFLGEAESEEQDVPFAYLNYILFDENNELVDAGWQRVSSDAGFLPGQQNPAIRPHIRLKFDHPISVTQPGSIYIWVSNESEDVKVWFDDLKVDHSTSLVVQATDYGVWGDVLREQKTEDKDYRFGYQGQFAERDKQTGWSHFELREYDPVIGRWLSVDPAGQFYSPYIGMGNNPISSVDSDGGEAYDWWKNNSTGKVEWYDGNPGEGYSWVGDDNFVFDGATLPTIEFTDLDYLSREYGALGIWFTRQNSSIYNPTVLSPDQLNTAANIQMAVVGAAFGVGYLLEAAPVAYSAIAPEVSDMSLYAYVQVEAAASQLLRAASQQVFKIGLRYATPGTTTMKMVIDAHWKYLRQGMKANVNLSTRGVTEKVEKIGNSINEAISNDSRAKKAKTFLRIGVRMSLGL